VRFFKTSGQNITFVLYSLWFFIPTGALNPNTPTLTRTSVLFYEGLPHNERTLDDELLDAFRELRHTLQYSAYTLDAASGSEIIFCIYPTDHYHINFPTEVNGERTRVTAEKEGIILRGSPEVIKPLLEFIYWVYTDKSSEALLNLELPLKPDPAEPSWLPSLLIFAQGVDILTAGDKKILALYGIGDKEIAMLERVRWVDIALANELWLQRPDVKFMDFLVEMGLLTINSA